MSPTLHRALVFIAIFLLGLVAGGYLFAKTLPRSFIALNECGTQCLELNDLAGLLASVGIQRAPGMLPLLVGQSAECVAVRHPRPEAPYHVTFLPKRDLRNILELTDEDVPYLLGCLALARQYVADARLHSYRIVTNGPGLQHVTYFHFHVIGQ
jgi:hypothetical protein